MRTFKEITDELGQAMDLVIGKKNNLDKVNKEADAMIAEANNKKANASNELNNAQNKAYDLRKEYDALMTELLPSVDNRVRQSGK